MSATTVLGFAAKMAKVSENIGPHAKIGVNSAAERVGRAANANVAAAIGADMALSGVKVKRGKAAKVHVDVRKASSATRPVALLAGTPAGLFTIVESGAHAHMVGAGRGVFASSLKTRNLQKVSAKTGKARKTNKRKLLGGGGFGPVYGPFFAGGSPAHRPLGKAASLGTSKVKSILSQEMRNAILKGGFR